jgi:histidyl-tRNA synthetase
LLPLYRQAEFMYKNKPKNIKLQFDVVDKESIPFAVIIGADEIRSGTVRIKDQTRTKEELAHAEAVAEGEGSSPNGELVQRSEMIDWIRRRLEVVGEAW